MLGALLGAVIALSPGAQAAQEPFCRPQPEPRETRMEAYQRVRGRYGFRTHRAYIRRLIRRGVRTGGPEEDFPVTRRERRYVRLRDRLTLNDAAYRYLRRHRDVDGGTSIEDAWPRDPHILVRLTRDRAKHQRALRRLVRYPRLLRTRRVALSERDLSRLQDRIDWEAAERDGFFISTSGPDIDTTTVELELITERTDAAAYFREHYGPRVRAIVIATELYSPRCTNLWDYVADGTRLTIGWEAGGGAKFDHAEVVETDERVTVGVVVQSFNGVQTADSARADHVIELASPLGDRRVVDATTGKPIRPRGDPY
jgi:hypothetical protein